MDHMEMNYVWLNGMPRSGTSWLSQIFDSHPNVRFKLSPLFSYAFKNAVDAESSIDEWLNFLQNVYLTEDDFMDQKYRRKNGEYPVFPIKNEEPSYLVIKDTRYHNLTKRIIETIPELTFIHIVRHPCGAINSWLRAPREFPKNADPTMEWRTGACRKTGSEEFWGFNDWIFITNLYLDLAEKHPDIIMMVRYEDLVNEPIITTNKLFNFMGLDMHSQTTKFLNDCHAKNILNEYAVYKNKEVKDKWKKQLNPKIVDEIYFELKGTRLERFLDE